MLRQRLPSWDCLFRALQHPSLFYVSVPFADDENSALIAKFCERKLQTSGRLPNRRRSRLAAQNECGPAPPVHRGCNSMQSEVNVGNQTHDSNVYIIVVAPLHLSQSCDLAGPVLLVPRGLVVTARAVHYDRVVLLLALGLARRGGARCRAHAAFALAARCRAVAVRA